MRVLAVNAGSRTLKLALVENGAVTAGEEIAAATGEIDRDAIARLAGAGADCSAHRFVHGGSEFPEPVVVDDGVRRRLGGLADLAPLHSKPALAGLDALRDVASGLPAVACFDSSFHVTLPAAARTYAIPWSWTEEHGIRRYGFHGLNHRYASRRAAEMLGRPVEDLRLVVCHLGGGASLCAVRFGRSVDTTMGFTPLEGLVMATRPGNVDPGALVWLQRHANLSVDELDDALEHASGIAGISGGSGDMRELIGAAGSGDERSRLALDVYLHRLRGQIASMVASAGGLDALVFTAGVGEHSPEVRAGAVGGLAFLGLQIDPELNTSGEGDRDVAADGSTARVLVVRAREELELAAQAEAVLGERP